MALIDYIREQIDSVETCLREIKPSETELIEICERMLRELHQRLDDLVKRAEHEAKSALRHGQRAAESVRGGSPVRRTDGERPTTHLR